MLAGTAASGLAQSPDAGSWAARVGAAYRVTNDIVYHRATGYDLKLDVYVPAYVPAEASDQVSRF